MVYCFKIDEYIVSEMQLEGCRLKKIDEYIASEETIKKVCNNINSVQFLPPVTLSTTGKRELQISN